MPQLRITLSPDNQLNHELSEDHLTVGRLADNTIQIEDGSVSSHHAEIVAEGGGFKLRDLDSTNGTFVNGAQITEHMLQEGDKVRFGQIDAVYGGDAAASGGDAQPMPSSGKIEASLGSASARPANFVSASPFPKPKEKTDPLTYAAIALGVIGVLGVVGAVLSSMALHAPV